MSRGIITQATIKNKYQPQTERRIGIKDSQEAPPVTSNYKIGEIATDGSFSCRPIVRTRCLDDEFVYYFEGVLFACPEESIRRPSETNRPLMPLEPPISTAKYKVGDVATVHIGSYLFACRRIVCIERLPDSAFHYIFEGMTGAYREGDVVLVEDTTPRMPIWDGKPGDWGETKSSSISNANAKYRPGDIATVQINGESLFPPCMILKIKKNEDSFDYFFDFDCDAPGYPEEDVVLASATADAPPKASLQLAPETCSEAVANSQAPSQAAPSQAAPSQADPPATEKQIKYGARFGLDLSGMSRKDARLAIKKAKEQFGNPATDKQKSYLEGYGVDTTNLSFEDAKAQIEEIAAWRSELADEIHSKLNGRGTSSDWYRCKCVYCASRNGKGRIKPYMAYRFNIGGPYKEIGYKCHLCGASGGTLDLANELNLSYAPGSLAQREGAKATPAPAPVETKKPAFVKNPAAYQSKYASHPQVLSRWQAYKPLNTETISRFGLGYGKPPDGRSLGLIVPIMESGEIIGFRCRHDDTGKWRTVKGSKTTLLNGELVTENCIVIVTENNVDSMFVMQEIPDICGMPVIAVSSTTGVWTWRDEWSQTLARAKFVVIATDNDHAGQPSEEYQALMREKHQKENLERRAAGKKPLPAPRLPGGFKAYHSLQEAGANVVLFPWAVNKMDVGDYLTGRYANWLVSEGAAISQGWQALAERAAKEEAAYEERFGPLNGSSIFDDFCARHADVELSEVEYVRPLIWTKTTAPPAPTQRRDEAFAPPSIRAMPRKSSTIPLSAPSSSKPLPSSFALKPPLPAPRTPSSLKQPLAQSVPSRPTAATEAHGTPPVPAIPAPQPPIMRPIAQRELNMSSNDVIAAVHQAMSQIDEINDNIQRLLTAASQSEPLVDVKRQALSQLEPSPKVHQQPADVSKTRQVLSQLGPERKDNKTTWLRVGQALHAEHGQDGLSLWQEWTADPAAPSRAYTVEDCQTAFAKFRNTSNYSLNTIQRWASEDQKNGSWRKNKINNILVNAAVERSGGDFIKNSTLMPNFYYDLICPLLDESELKVLLYAFRLTIGYRYQNENGDWLMKRKDRIALSQFSTGRMRRDGGRLDYGTGLSQPTVRKAINRLKKLGILIELAPATATQGKLYSVELHFNKVDFQALEARKQKKSKRYREQTKAARGVQSANVAESAQEESPEQPLNRTGFAHTDTAKSAPAILNCNSVEQAFDMQVPDTTKATDTPITTQESTPLATQEGVTTPVFAETEECNINIEAIDSNQLNRTQAVELPPQKAVGLQPQNKTFKEKRRTAAVPPSLSSSDFSVKTKGLPSVFVSRDKTVILPSLRTFNDQLEEPFNEYTLFHINQAAIVKFKFDNDSMADLIVKINERAHTPAGYLHHTLIDGDGRPPHVKRPIIPTRARPVRGSNQPANQPFAPLIDILTTINQSLPADAYPMVRLEPIAVKLNARGESKKSVLTAWEACASAKRPVGAFMSWVQTGRLPVPEPIPQPVTTPKTKTAAQPDPNLMGQFKPMWEVSPKVEEVEEQLSVPPVNRDYFPPMWED